MSYTSNRDARPSHSRASRSVLTVRELAERWRVDVKTIYEAIEQGGLEHMDSVIDAIQSTGALEYTAEFARRESEAALAALSRIPDSDYKQALAALARLSVDRTF